MTISTIIRELRKKKGYTQNELAEFLGIGQTTVANYEQGRRIPDTLKLQKIADLFEVSLDYIVGREESEFSASPVRTYSVKDIENTHKVYINLLLDGKRGEARKLVLDLYEEDIDVEIIYFKVFEKALKEVGTLWEMGVLDIWKEHFISEITIDIMREIKVKAKRGKNKGISLMALTSGPELHNIGIRMITDILDIQGYHTIYLGSNVPASSLIKAIEAEKPEALALSVTLESHLESAKNMISAVKAYFKGKSPKIIVGGSAFMHHKNICEEIGADYCSKNMEDIYKALESI